MTKACLLASLILLVGHLSLVKANIPLLSASECNLKSLNIKCASNETVLPNQVLDGVRTTNNGQCEYTQGDCYENGRVQCNGLSSTCTATLASVKPLEGCPGKVADYRTVRHFCVPRVHPNKYDICATAEITAPNGIITSPGYTSYQQVEKPCTTKITAPPGSSINIFTYDMVIKGRNEFENCDDYLRIIDANNEFSYCGTEIDIVRDRLCSNVIYVSYKAAAARQNSYRGFALYFEVRSLGPGSGCSGVTPTAPPVEPTTTRYLPAEPSTPQYASEAVRFQVCKGKSQTITAPDYSLVYIEEINFRVQNTISLTCLPTAFTDCVGPYYLDCNLRQMCTFSLVSETVFDCQNKDANSITGVYRFIPYASTVKYAVCSSQTISGDNAPKGVITSRNFPSFETNVQCQTRLQSVNANKAFKIYITDINIEASNDCTNSYVELDDRVKVKTRYCGAIDFTKSYSYTSCSNNVDINYRTTGTNAGYRGFRAYYELIDLPVSCLPTTTKSTRPPLTTAPSTDVTSQLLTTNGQTCVFPFRYNSTTSFDVCVPENLVNNYWCSLTFNYEQDQRRADCSKGLTQYTKFSVCRLKFVTMSCPKNYVIHVIAVTGYQTRNGICDQEEALCRHDSYSSYKAQLSGKNSYRFGGIYSLSSCSNAVPDLTVVEYNCVPDTVPYIETYDICNGGSITAENVPNGFLISPGYPSDQTNRNCNFTINTQGEKKILNVYSISAALHVPGSGQQCSEAYVDINGDKYCGSLLTEFFAQKCSTSFKFNFVVGAKAYKGFKLYFEVDEVKDGLQCIEATTRDPTQPTTLTPQPPWAFLNVSSGPLSVVKCASNPISTIQCPKGYIISTTRYFFGRSSQNNCFYSNGDCIGVSADQTLRCTGLNECDLPPYSAIIPSCGGLSSTYLQVDYQCIPTLISRSRPSCSSVTEYSNKNGIIATPNHPIYDNNLNCPIKIKTTSEKVIKAYLIETSIDNDCSKDYVRFSEPSLANPNDAVIACGQYNGELLYETCNEQLDIQIKTGSLQDNNLRGVAIYYESIDRPAEYECVKQTNPPSPTTRPTLPTFNEQTSTVSRPSYQGLASPILTYISCQDGRIECPADYVIIIRAAFYGVKNTPGTVCGYNPDDCFGVYSSPSWSCGGYNGCSLYFYSTNTVPQCGNRENSYHFVEYQCVPIKNAGRPTNPTNTEFCSEDLHQVKPESSMVIQSPNHKSYPLRPVNCTRNVQINSDYVMDVYLTVADFRGFNSCNQSTDYVKITDGVETFWFCKSLNDAKFLMRTRSFLLSIESQILSVDPPTTIYYGFQFYIEAVHRSAFTTDPTRITARPTTTRPIVPGLASDNYHVDMCQREIRDLRCPSNYIIIVGSEFLIDASNTSCIYTDGDCRGPTSLVADTCAGKDFCRFSFVETPLPVCNAEYANAINFRYRCVPALPMENVKSYSCNKDKVLDRIKNGFIESPDYPIFGENVNDCRITLIPPVNSEYRLYAIDISLSARSNNSISIESSLIIYGDTPRLLANIFSQTDVVYNSPRFNGTVRPEPGLRGFRIYFEAFPVTNGGSSTRPTTKQGGGEILEITKINRSDKSKTLTIATFSVGIPLIVAIVLLILFLHKYNGSFGSSSSSATSSVFSSMRVNFSSKNKDGELNEDIKSFSNPVASGSFD